MTDEEEINEVTPEQASDAWGEGDNFGERSFGEVKDSIHSFLTNIVKTKDTSKVGNLTQGELGYPVRPVRIDKELAILTEDHPAFAGLSSYFNEMAEMSLATSLSKEGFLVKQATTQRKEFTGRTTTKKDKKSGLFSRNKESTTTEVDV